MSHSFQRLSFSRAHCPLIVLYPTVFSSRCDRFRSHPSSSCSPPYIAINSNTSHDRYHCKRTRELYMCEFDKLEKHNQIKIQCYKNRILRLGAGSANSQRRRITTWTAPRARGRRARSACDSGSGQRRQRWRAAPSQRPHSAEGRKSRPHFSCHSSLPSNRAASAPLLLVVDLR